MASSHGHTDVEVNLLLRGSMRYQLPSGWHTVEAGTLMAFWAALPHRLAEVDGAPTCVWMTVPLGWFLGQASSARFATALLQGRLITDRQPEDEARARSWIADLARPDPAVARAVRLEVEARLLRLPVPPVTRGETLGTGGAGEHVQTMIETISRRFSEDLDVATLTRATGLNPHYAMTLFKQAMGVSVWDYLTRLRISHAQNMLIDGDSAVIDAALASGFGSQSRFYAAFKRVVGCTPGAWRTDIAAGRRQPPSL